MASLCVLPVYTNTTIIILYGISEEEVNPQGTMSQRVAKPTELYTERNAYDNCTTYKFASKFSHFAGIMNRNCYYDKEMCMDILRRLRDAVRRKRPEKWRTNSCFLLHHNAPAHRSVLVMDFLTKNNVATLEHPPCNRDLASADFYLFPRLKS